MQSARDGSRRDRCIRHLHARCRQGARDRPAPQPPRLDPRALRAAPLAGGEPRRAAAPVITEPRPISASSAIPCSNGRPMPSSAALRSESIVVCGNAARPSAISSARSRWRPGGTTSVTRPHSCASAASSTRPVRIISSARPMPTMRGSRCVPPSINGTPKRRSVNPSRALSVAIRRSHHSASSSPPARHQPETAAIVGFEARRRVKPSGPSGRPSSQAPTVPSGSSPENSCALSANAFRSAPAQKASGPSPVSTSARASSSASKR